MNKTTKTIAIVGALAVVAYIAYRYASNYASSRETGMIDTLAGSASALLKSAGSALGRWYPAEKYSDTAITGF